MVTGNRTEENGFFTRFGLWLFAGLFISILVTHLAGGGTTDRILFIPKLLLVALFLVIAWKSEVNALSAFLATLIVFGVFGHFHRIYSWLTISVLFLIILACKCFVIQENRRYLFSRIKASTLFVPLLVSGVVVPVLGSITGLIKGNETIFLLKDADGWFFYLLFPCLLGLVRTDKQFNTVNRIFILAIVALSILITVASIMVFSGLLSAEFVIFFFYNALRLGGHIEHMGNNFLRIYTGNGLFLTTAISYIICLILWRTARSPVRWIVAFSFVLYAYIVSYTRGYWLAGVITLLLIFVFVPVKHKKKFSMYGILFVILSLIILLPFRVSPVRYVLNECNRLYQSIYFFGKMDVIYAATSGRGVFKSLDGGGTWTNVGGTLPRRIVSAVDIDPQDLKTVYVGTRGKGVFVSRNLGETWQSVNHGMESLDVRALCITALPMQSIYAATAGAGVFRRTHSEETWLPVSDGLEQLDVRSLKSGPGGIIYSVTQDGTKYRLAASGTSWIPDRNAKITVDARALARKARKTTLYAGVLEGEVHKFSGLFTSLKVKQYRALYFHTREQLLMGHGFGATLPGNLTFRLNDSNPHIFEAGYGDLFMKTGLIGLFLWFVLPITMVIQTVRHYSALTYNAKMLVLSFLFPMIGTLFTYATNPYLYSPFGITPLLYTAFIIDHVIYRHKKAQEL